MLDFSEYKGGRERCIAMANAPNPDTVPCTHADCLLADDLRNGLVAMVTITSSLSIILCTYVIVTIQAYQR